MKRSGLVLILAGILLLASQPVHAQSTPVCVLNLDGSITCTTGGDQENGNDGNGNGSGNGAGGETCTEGQHVGYEIVAYDAATGICQAFQAQIDNCTGQFIEAVSDDLEEFLCTIQAEQPEAPCDTFSFSLSGITCANNRWNLSARVTFPEIYLDVRPYPATLVRWPTAIRNGGLNTASGSDGVAYISNGGGSQNAPQVGDWRDLCLILTLRPVGAMSVTLPRLGTFALADAGPTGNPLLVQWEVPSHPAVGAGPLAGSIAGLDELPSDMPLFVGRGRTAYRLTWELWYDAYEEIEECQPGPNGNGLYTCGGGTGHQVVVGYEWNRHSSSGEISPLEVQNVPAALMADNNGDGMPDSFWNNNLTLRRMDESGSVNNPQYQRSWNWNGAIYWAVREGQGQIGWPGVP